MKFYVFLLAVGLVALAFNVDSEAIVSTQHDMAVCQLSRSFDTCFQALNR